VAEPQHRAFPSSKWQVRILSPVVQPMAGFLPVGYTDLLQGCAVRSQFVGDEDSSPFIPLHGFFQGSQRGFLVPRKFSGNRKYSQTAR
jgi:hypothetical protein